MGEEEKAEPKFTLRAVDGIEKSLAEREAEILGEKDVAEDVPSVVISGDEPKVEPVIETTDDLPEENVLSYLKKRLNRDINSFDDLVETKVEYKEAELSEDLQAIKKFKEETGRGVKDWIELQKDFTAIDDDAILMMYNAIEQPHLTNEDHQFEISDAYGYDEDVDDEATIRRRKIAKRKKVEEARKHFNDSKEKYKAPLESGDGFISTEERTKYNEWKQYNEQAEESQQKRQKKAEYFSTKTDELFSEKFEGFEFTVGDDGKKVQFKLENPKSVKETQMNVDNFIAKHLNEDGLLKDAAEYHRSLYAGMNPDKLAKFFYELGQAEAIEKGVKESKQIDMKPNPSGSAPKPGGIRMTVVNPSTTKGGGLRVNIKK